MHHWPSIVVGSGVLAAALALYVVDPTPLDVLDNMGQDMLLKRVRRGVYSDEILILDIDERSLAARGQWPWPRTDMADLVTRLDDAGAAAIAMDIIFVEPDRLSPVNIVGSWREQYGVTSDLSDPAFGATDYDHVFAEALEDAPAVLGCFVVLGDAPLESLPETETSVYRGSFFEKGKSRHEWLPQGHQLIAPLPVLVTNAADTAFINTVPDRDGIIRRTPLAIAYGPSRIYPSLGLSALRTATDARLGVFYDNEGADGIMHVSLQNRDNDLNLSIPTDANGRLLLNFRTNSFRRVSATDLLEGRVPSEAIEGSIVFVGASAAALGDLVKTPFDDELPGVEVHATLIDNVLYGDVLVSPRWMRHATLLGLLLGGAIVIVLTTCTSALLSVPAILLAMGGTIGLSIMALHKASLVTVPAYPMLVWGVIYLSVTVVKYWQEERARKRVRNMFGTMVSPSVLQYLETTPGSFSLRGEKKEATIMFSDIIGFTSISERMSPEDLTSMLHRFLGPMTRIVMDEQGYVDKLQGDAIMAEWGVPFPVADHAVRACRAALAQHSELATLLPSLMETFDYELRMGTGINSGVVTAGNMGSEDPPRFQFTVLGDAVNQAARLETATRMYGVPILIGESTAELVADSMVLRQVDLVCLKGKEQATRIYEVIAERDKQSTPSDWVATYERALELMHKREFDAAEKAFREVIATRGEDGPSDMMLLRIAGYRENPPPDNWGGEFVLTSK